jgi:phosphate transport system substrate-binding protein
MISKKVAPILLAIVLFSLTIGSQALCAADSLKSAGCKTEIFLLKDIAEAYKAETGKSIRLGGTGNKKAVNLLLEEKVDFAFTCKPIDKIAKGMKLKDQQVASWQSIAIAKDPIVIIANSSNGVTNITQDELTKIFQGQITNWKELGGNDLPVLPAYLSEYLESGLVLLFKEFTKAELTDQAMKAKAPNMLGNYTSVTPGAIGFLNYNTYQEKYGVIMQVNGIAPTDENILNGTYPLTATYFLTIDDRNNQAVAEFVDFTKSAAGKNAIKRNYIPIAD